MKTTCAVLLIVAISCQKISANERIEGQGVQVISPRNHVFHLELDELKPILENDSIKDRNVVIVSIAGAFRQGKSFLLNFFIKYLNAQYKRHDVNDWMGENGNSGKLDGFKWRGGLNRETTGIWMWSDVFTHDYESGEKVAIILLDTQGIFDDQTGMKECTTIFALSMMLSSVQCYNVMHKIREDDLQHLDLFTEYGRLAFQQLNQKPFQKLLFIIRDWPYAEDIDYGWHGQKYIDEILRGNEHQTEEMLNLRKRIKSNFENISAFLMPFPGIPVAQGKGFSGELQKIESEFKLNVKKLVTDIFAPENLIVKNINGQNVRVRDLVQFIETYLNIFNGDTLPEPKSILMATAEASLQILSSDCLNLYINSMQGSLNEVESYIDQNELVFLHQRTKNEAITQFKAVPKLGDEQFVFSFEQKIAKQIEEKFQVFNETNEVMYKSFIDKANLHNEKIVVELKDMCEKKVTDEVKNTKQSLKQSALTDFSMNLRHDILKEFDDRKMGKYIGYRESLVQHLDSLQLKLIKISESYYDSLSYYTDKIQKKVAKGYLSQNDLLKLLQNSEKEAKIQFSDKTRDFDDKLTLPFERRLENEIEDRSSNFEQVNEGKLKEFIEKSKSHNEIISNEIKAKFESNVRNGIGQNYLDDNSFISLFFSSKENALKEFASRKMGDELVTSGVREKLERDLDQLQTALKKTNQSNKPLEPPTVERECEKQKPDNERLKITLDFIDRIAPKVISLFNSTIFGNR